MGRIYTASEVVEKFAISRQTLTNKLQTGQITASKNPDSGSWHISEKAILSAGIPYRTGAEKTIRDTEEIKTLTETHFTKVFTQLEELKQQSENQLNQTQNFTKTNTQNQRSIYEINAQILEKITHLEAKISTQNTSSNDTLSKKDVEKIIQNTAQTKNHQILELKLTQTLTRLQKIIKETREQFKESGQTWNDPEDHYFLNLAGAVQNLQEQKNNIQQRLTTTQKQITTLEKEKTQLEKEKTQERENKQKLVLSAILGTLFTLTIMGLIIKLNAYPIYVQAKLGTKSQLVVNANFSRALTCFALFWVYEVVFCSLIYWIKPIIGLVKKSGSKN